MAGNLKLTELRFGTLNNVQENSSGRTGDRRRTSTTSALRMTMGEAFNKNQLRGVTEYNGIIVHARVVTYPTYKNKGSLLAEYVVADNNVDEEESEESPEMGEYQSIVYKVFIPELEPRPAPTSDTDPILRSYADVYCDIPEAMPPGTLVVIKDEDDETLFNPRIIRKLLNPIAIEGFENSQINAAGMFNGGKTIVPPPEVELTGTIKTTDEPPGVIKRAKTLGYKTFDKEPYRLWIFGIRDHNRTDNKFNDVMGIVYVDDDGKWNLHQFPATTDPGWKTLRVPYADALKKGGTAILKPGQYLDTWVPTIHRENYRALGQAKPVPVYRDPNLDTVLDMNPETLDDGLHGINLHASWTKNGRRIIDASNVDGQSAGCQVFKTREGFGTMMALVDIQIEKTKSRRFSYTLLDKWPAPAGSKTRAGKDRPEEKETETPS